MVLKGKQKMLEGPFLSKSWMGENPDYNSADIVMLGLPFDGTVSYRSGSRFAPERLRPASWELEEYSPALDKSIEDANFIDIGDLEFPLGNTQKSLGIIEKNVAQVYADDKKIFGIGGEHLVTLPSVKGVLSKYKDLAIIHFDAHTDLRKEYLGENLSHATVMYNVAEMVGFENLKQIGIRSGTKEEWALCKKYNTLVKDFDDLSSVKNKKIYITLDLDVLDPSVMSGTGTPEAGGFGFSHLLDWVYRLKDFDIVGCDVVELAPDYDTSGCSTATAAKIIRELLLIM